MVESINFIAGSLIIEREYKLDQFILKALDAAMADIDYQAIMSNRESINKTFQPNCGWPSVNYTFEENFKAIQRHEIEFVERSTFVYAIFLNDNYIGCLYIRPVVKKSMADIRSDCFDAQVFFWLVNSVRSNYSNLIYNLLTKFVTDKFRLRNIAFPGRDISWRDWELLAHGWLL